MKYLLIFFTFYFSLSFQSQNNDYYKIIYDTKSMILKTYKKPRQAYASLYVHNDSSIYQLEIRRQLDSVKAKRKTTNKDLNRYFSLEKYAIEYEGNKLKYYDSFGGNEYEYKEEVVFNWNLKPETKIIKGYKCKKATVSYGGREWIAWYTLDLPINAGPYKFKGLPGLIIKINDTSNSYSFEVYSIEAKKHLPLKKLFHLKKEGDRITLDRTKYNEIRFKYKSLGFQERMNLLNKKQGVTNEMVITSTDGNTNPFANERNVNRAERNNFIEIDHKK
mgnify:CR=1 FL=1